MYFSGTLCFGGKIHFLDKAKFNLSDNLGS